MNRRTSKRVISILLAMVMLIGLLPAAVYAATYTKLGEVTEVTAKSFDYVAPALGAEVVLPSFTVQTPKNQNVHIFWDAVYTYWQKLDEDGNWMKYTKSIFEEGSYRVHIGMYSNSFSDGTYYALRNDTTLTVDGVEWTDREPLMDTYAEKGTGQIIFYSPVFQVTPPAGTYTVVVTAGAGGTASASCTTGKTGDVVTLTATPDSLYRLQRWEVLSGGVTVTDDSFTIGNANVEIQAVFESAMVNRGALTKVQVTAKEDTRPLLGEKLSKAAFTVVSPLDANITFGWTYWEKLQSDGNWAVCDDEICTYGTYRRNIQMLSKALEDGSYYPITKDTVLSVDGVEWTIEDSSIIDAYVPEQKYGAAYFVGPEMDAIPIIDVSDITPAACYVEPVLGQWSVPMGDAFSFTVAPKAYYEQTDPDALKVYVNDILVTPDANGVYTVQNVTETLEIYCDGSGFTGYSNLVISANGKTVTEKVYVGDTYTFKTLDAFGATVPEGSTFTGWKLGGKIYQPGDTYTVKGNTEIAVNAAFKGLYNVTVENGKAYADEAHTQPVSAAAENQVIYVVADPAPEGKVFSYWNRTFVTVGGHGWFGDSESAETTFTVYDSDVILAPVYEISVDEIVISGMTKPIPGGVIDNSDYSYRWGCSVPADAGYTLGINYWYDITDGEPEFAMSSGEAFQVGHTYRFMARIHLKADYIYPANPEDIAVRLDGIAPEDYTYTIYEVGYTSATIYFEFDCKRVTPDTSYIRPKGDGTEAAPFQLTNVGELYWFAAFVNGQVTAEDITVAPQKAHAKLMNDITVNPNLLSETGALFVPEGVVQWTPISSFAGVFDGQNHTISGIHCAPESVGKNKAMGFFAYMDIGSYVCNLTLADSLFSTSSMTNVYAGGIVGRNPYGVVENCHFSGTVSSAPMERGYDNYIAGIAGYLGGEVRNCTVKGKITGCCYQMAGIAADVYYGTVIGCVNEAAVSNTRSETEFYYTAGIAGSLCKGTVQDCCNKAKIFANWLPVGVVAHVEDADSSVIRCWNAGEVGGGAGIVGKLSGTIENCYNTGKVRYGIVSIAYSKAAIRYCHNVGEITVYGTPICDAAHADTQCESCYYLASSELDDWDGTTYKTAAEFANGTVLALLNNGNWTQGEEDAYPVLAEKTDYLPGDTNGDGVVTNADVVQLMWFVLFPEANTIVGNADFTGDGSLTNADVVQLMWFVLFPEQNPLF